MSAAEMRHPAPCVNAGNRAEVIRNKTPHIIARTKSEADFASIYLALWLGLAMPLAPASASQANLERVRG
jgi:hypothetical protein